METKTIIYWTIGALMLFIGYFNRQAAGIFMWLLLLYSVIITLFGLEDV